MKTILVIDAQGGGIGKQLISEIRKKELQAEIIAVGTNSTASAQMLKAGADHAATGENPVLVNCRKADVILGPIGIVLADAMFGEITPAIAAAVGQSCAAKILIPMNSCGAYVVGVADRGIKSYIEEAIEQLITVLNL
ncbi:MAG: DUF3842 family protein [Lachnospiraceae bacterium]|nr:DUF3842 family protein [Lachnospiraceae bacterium]